MDTLLKRIKQIALMEGITITELERMIGASKGVLSRAINTGTDIQTKWLQLIVEKYPLYSERWLLTGKGDAIEEQPLRHRTPDILEPAAPMGDHDAGKLAAYKEELKECRARIEQLVAEKTRLEDSLKAIERRSSFQHGATLKPVVPDAPPPMLELPDKPTPAPERLENPRRNKPTTHY